MAHDFGALGRGAARAARRDARRGAPPARRELSRPLSPPALGRPAAAGRTGDGVRLPPQCDRAGRADDRARRHHAGARARHRPRPLQRPPRRGALRQPRPRRRVFPREPRRGHVRGPHRGAGPARRSLSPGGASVLRAASSKRFRRCPAATRSSAYPGTAPRPGHGPSGCFFSPRCTYAVDRCAVEFPPVERVGERHEVRCYRHAQVLEEAGARPEAGRATPRARPGGRVGDRGGADQRLLRGTGGAPRREPGRPAAGVPSPRRRVGVRQDHPGALYLRPAPGLLRRDHVAGRAPPARDAGALARDAPEDPVRLPEPVHVAQPAKDGGPDRRPAAQASSSGSGGARSRPASSECSSEWRSAPSVVNRYPDRSPAERGSGSPSRARSCASRRF